MNKQNNDFEHEATPVARESGNDEELVYNSTEEISESSAPEWDEDKTEVFIQSENTENNQPSLISGNGESYQINCFPYLIGRDISCHLQPEGRGISRKHAEIFQQSGRLVIKDLDSSNGTKVNGYLITQVLLENNDIITIGDADLTFKTFSEIISTPESDQEIEVPSLQALRDTLPKTSNNINLKLAGLFSLVIALAFFGINYYQANKQSLVVPPTPFSNTASTPQESQKAPDLSAPFPDVAGNVDTTAGDYDKTEQDKKPDIELASINQTSAEVKSANIMKSESGSSDKASLQLEDLYKKKPDSLSTYTQTPSIPAAPDKSAKTVKKRSQGISQAKVDEIYSTAKNAYIEGNASKAIYELKKTEAINTQTGLLYSKVNNTHTLYEQGNLAQKQGEKDKAIALWSEYLDEAKSIFPDQSSPYQKEAINFLAKEYETNAKLAEQNNNYPEAYIYWEKLFILTGSDEAKTSIDGLDNLAQDMFRNGLRQEYINIEKAVNYWQQVLSIVPPSNSYYQKADEKIKAHSRWK